MTSHRIIVLHRAWTDFSGALPAEKEVFTYAGYVDAPVTLPAEALDAAYGATQNIDHAWGDHPTWSDSHVARSTHASQRSTSMGDILWSKQSGEGWLVAAVGFQPIDGALLEAITEGIGETGRATPAPS